MQLSLNNVGIIKDSSVLIDGLTVITGKNSSGKTTVGKTLYSLVAASINVEDSFITAREQFVFSQLNQIREILKLNYFYHYARRNRILDNNSAIYALAMRSLFRSRESSYIAFIKDLYQELLEFSKDDYINMINSIVDTNALKRIPDDSYVKNILEDYDAMIEIALNTCTFTIEIIESSSIETFQKERTKAFLLNEFNKQIQPVKNKKAKIAIDLKANKGTIVSLTGNSNNSLYFLKKSSFNYPFKSTYFIDNPFIVDDLDRYEDSNDVFEEIYYYSSSQSPKKITVSSDAVPSHKDNLLLALLTNAQTNYFYDLAFVKKYGTVVNKINDILSGDVQKNNKGTFYTHQGVNLSISNLATGSKTFMIVKMLLSKGLLSNDTLLVFDEPESHLHPEWLNKFAEILVLLIKDVGTKIVLTTHSPNLLLALNVFAKEYGISESAHFYLAESNNKEGYSQIRNIDENINEGYSHLSIPFVEMNLKLKSIQDEG